MDDESITDPQKQPQEKKRSKKPRSKKPRFVRFQISPDATEEEMQKLVDYLKSIPLDKDSHPD